MLIPTPRLRKTDHRIEAAGDRPTGHRDALTGGAAPPRGSIGDIAEAVDPAPGLNGAFSVVGTR